MSHGPGWHELSSFVTFCHPVLGARGERAYFNPETEVGRARRLHPFSFRTGHQSPGCTRMHQQRTGIDILRFRPPGSDRWRFLYQASGPLMQVLDRALKTLPFLYLFFTTFAFLPVKPIRSGCTRVLWSSARARPGSPMTYKRPPASDHSTRVRNCSAPETGAKAGHRQQAKEGGARIAVRLRALFSKNKRRRQGGKPRTRDTAALIDGTRLREMERKGKGDRQETDQDFPRAAGAGRGRNRGRD